VLQPGRKFLIFRLNFSSVQGVGERRGRPSARKGTGLAAFGKFLKLSLTAQTHN